MTSTPATMLSTSDLLGSFGVALLLVAFLLNLLGRLDSRSRVYAALNLAGAGLSCYASMLIGFIPFVVLEGVWAIVALAGLLRRGQPAAR